MYEQVVGGYAGLACADIFSPGDAAGGDVKVCGFVDDAGVSAAQFEGYGGEVFGGCGGYFSAGFDAAGEEDVVVWFVEADFGEEGYPGLGECFGQDGACYPEGFGCTARGFCDDDVSAGEGSGDWHHEEEEGVVPGGDDEDEVAGFGCDFGFCGGEEERGSDFLGAGPFAEIFFQCFDFP